MSVATATLTHGQAKTKAEYAKNEDYKLLRSYSSGSEEAFQTLYQRYSQKLLYFVYRNVRDWQAAEDIVQEIFIQIMKDADTFEPRAALSTWIFRIATFMCLKYRRDNGIRSRILAREAENGTFYRDNPEPQAAEAVLDKERVKALKALVEDLPQRHKKMIQLREYDNLSYQEMASEMGIGIGTVKSRLFRARQVLRDGLKQRELL